LSAYNREAGGTVFRIALPLSGGIYKAETTAETKEATEKSYD